jgi:hypothetical protein
VYAIAPNGRRYWSRRNALGQFVTRRGFNRSQLFAQHEAWRAYLEARRDSADAATRGHLLSAAARTRWSSIERMFTPGASLRHASAELRDWFRVNGPTMTRREFIAGWSDPAELEALEAAG